MSNQLIKPLNRKLLKGILFSPNEIEKKWSQSEHFHAISKGCEIEPKKITYKRGTRIFSIKGGFCKTHQKEICHCGWEFHFHYGTYSGKIEKGRL